MMPGSSHLEDAYRLEDSSPDQSKGNLLVSHEDLHEYLLQCTDVLQGEKHQVSEQEENSLNSKSMLGSYLAHSEKLK